MIVVLPGPFSHLFCKLHSGQDLFFYRNYYFALHADLKGITKKIFKNYGSPTLHVV